MPKSRLNITDLTMDKPYLQIGEVAKRFAVSIDLLRKWEHDFPQYLRPRRTKGETRLYDAKALQQVAVIYRLMRVEGLSVEGAKRRLREGNMAGDEMRQEVIARLQALRNQLMGIVEELNGSEGQ